MFPNFHIESKGWEEAENELCECPHQICQKEAFTAGNFQLKSNSFAEKMQSCVCMGED